MIEIIVVILLCNKNAKNAKARGKSGGAAVAYTIGLWFGGEILGALIGVAASGGEVVPPVYIAALLFAAGGGVASYFIAKSGTIVAQNQQHAYPPSANLQNVAYQAQQPQPMYTSQQAQPLPPHPGQQPQSVYTGQQAQPLPPHPGQQPQPQVQAVQTQGQYGTATIAFTAKKAMGQFLVSSVTIEVNGVPYQAGFNQQVNIPAPAGNVQIECYLNYMGKSGIAQIHVALAPNQSYQLEYKSPMVVTGSGTLNIMQI